MVQAGSRHVDGTNPRAHTSNARSMILPPSCCRICTLASSILHMDANMARAMPWGLGGHAGSIMNAAATGAPPHVTKSPKMAPTEGDGFHA